MADARAQDHEDGDRMTSQIEQQASGMQGHLPECFMAARLGVDTYAPDVLAQMKRAGCICHRLRSCEARVRSEDDDYAYVAAQAEADGRRRGWSEALDAAIGVVVTWQADRALPPFTALLAALNALRDQPADQTGYNLQDAP